MNKRTFRASEAHKLEDPARQSWLPVSGVVSLLGLREGMTIGDIGAGTGYFTLPFAREVGPSGRVFAVDLQREMLDLIANKLRIPGSPSNIDMVQGDATGTSLPSASVDLVFMANIWHELDDHASTLKEAQRILRSGGQLAILDWRPDVPHPPGPPPDHRIPAHAVMQTLEHDGWQVGKSTNVGLYGYLIVSGRTVRR